MKENNNIEDIVKKEIGVRFREFRKANDILQTDLEENVPTTNVQISRIENGHRYPSPEILIYMAKRHSMDINYILTGSSVRKGSLQKLPTT